MNFEEMSTSEIVALCKNNGVPGAHRGLSRDLLIDLCVGLEEAGDFSDPLDRVRDASKAFIAKYKPMISTLPCDAVCGNCSMSLTVGCYADNTEPLNKLMENEDGSD